MGNRETGLKETKREAWKGQKRNLTELAGMAGRWVGSENWRVCEALEGRLESTRRYTSTAKSIIHPI